MKDPTKWRDLRRQYTATGSKIDVSTSGNRGEEILLLIPLGMNADKVMTALHRLTTIISVDFPRERRRQKARERRRIAERQRQATENTEAEKD